MAKQKPVEEKPLPPPVSQVKQPSLAHRRVAAWHAANKKTLDKGG